MCFPQSRAIMWWEFQIGNCIFGGKNKKKNRKKVSLSWKQKKGHNLDERHLRILMSSTVTDYSYIRCSLFELLCSLSPVRIYVCQKHLFIPGYGRWTWGHLTCMSLSLANAVPYWKASPFQCDGQIRSLGGTLTWATSSKSSCLFCRARARCRDFPTPVCLLRKASPWFSIQSNTWSEKKDRNNDFLAEGKTCDNMCGC